MPKVLTPGTSAEERRRKAAEGGESTKKYRVKPGHTVTLAEDRNGEMVQLQYEAGEEVELTEAQAKAMPWAVDTGERRARAGQSSRLKQEIERLQAENKRLKDEAKRTKKGDEGREQARESLMARGDNYIGRGEPQIGSVPAEVADAHDRALLNAEMGVDADDLESDDELAGGMHGMARETAGADGVHGAATETKSAESVPADLEPGQSQRPGESSPRGKGGRQGGSNS